MRNIVIYFLLISAQSFAISGKEFLKNIRSNYEDLKSLELSINYKLYQGYLSDKVVEEYNSEYMRSESGSYRKIGDTEIISTNSQQLMIDHESNVMYLTKSQRDNPLNIDIKETLKFCKDIIVKDNGDTKELRLLIKDGTDLPYAQVKVDVDKRFWISSITFYYAIQVDFSDSYYTKEMDNPRLEVSYVKLKKRWNDREDLLSLDRFIKKSNSQFKTTSLYSSYQLLDLRNQIK